MRPDVTLTIPADTAYVSVVRTLAAAMAARADLPIDQLEDVRLAVDEAVSQVVADASPGADVTCRFAHADDVLDIVISAPSASGAVPATGTFGWTVLTALVDSVAASVDDGVVSVHLVVTRAIPVQA